MVTALPLPLSIEALCRRTWQAFFQLESPVFFHEKRDKELAWLEPARRQKRNNATCSDLESSGNGNGFWYTSEALDDTNSEVFAQALTVRELATRPESVNVWMGGRGVVAAAHYDFHHNAFLQLGGRKRWTLALPSEALRARLFPVCDLVSIQPGTSGLCRATP